MVVGMVNSMAWLMAVSGMAVAVMAVAVMLRGCRKDLMQAWGRGNDR